MATRNENSKAIEQVLIRFPQCDVNQYCNKYSLLCYAVRGNNLTLAEMLLSRNADPNAPVEPGCTTNALAMAYDAKNVEMGELLLRHGANPNTVMTETFLDETILLRAFSYDCVLSWVKLLISHGADIKFYFPTADAIMNFQDENLVALLLEKGADPNIANYRGLPLTLAMDAGQKTVWDSQFEQMQIEMKQQRLMKLLLENGADPNRKEQGAPLMFKLVKAINPNYTKIELLLSHGADPNIEDDLGDSAYTLAVSKGDLEMVKLFLKHNKPDKMPKLLTIAAGAHDVQMTSLLLANGVTADEKTTQQLIAMGMAEPPCGDQAHTAKKITVR